MGKRAARHSAPPNMPKNGYYRRRKVAVNVTRFGANTVASDKVVADRVALSVLIACILVLRKTSNLRPEYVQCSQFLIVNSLASNCT